MLTKFLHILVNFLLSSLQHVLCVTMFMTHTPVRGLVKLNLETLAVILHGIVHLFCETPYLEFTCPPE